MLDTVGAAWTRRVQAGDLAAFDRLMRLHERRVSSTALRLLGNSEDSQDVAQEVSCLFFDSSTGSIRPRSSWSPREWLSRGLVGAESVD